MNKTIEIAKKHQKNGLVSDSNADVSEACANSQEAYSKPVLIRYGDVRDITLGGSIGLGESGSGTGGSPPRRPL